MKAILLSIKPEWLAKILNGEKTVEVRKLFPKDYVGWVYLYCSKSGDLMKEYDTLKFTGNLQGKMLRANYNGKGKVVARFWCDKVEEIVLNKNHFVNEQYYTDELDYEELLEQSCLTYKELDDYLQCEIGYAIHISDLEIFDRPRELSEFQLWCNNICTNCKHLKMFDQTLHCRKPMLTKAPQNYCYIEGE